MPASIAGAAKDAMDDPAAAGLLDRSEAGPLALVGVGFETGVDDVALQLTTARPSTTTIPTRNELARLPALIGAL